jgi:integrase
VLGAVHVDALTGAHTEALLDDLRCQQQSASTIRGVVTVLRRAYDLAVQERYVTRNPIEVTAKQIGTCEQGEAFTRSHQESFFATAERTQPPALRLLHILVRTGVRIEEGLGLQWPYVDLGRQELAVRYQWDPTLGRLRPTKGKRSRVVDLTPGAAAHIDALPRTSPWLFPGPRGAGLRPYSHRAVLAQFHAVKLDAGLWRECYVLHSLRHTYATRLVEAGVDLRYISEQLGHASISITSDLYARSARSPRPAGLDSLDF